MIFIYSLIYFYLVTQSESAQGEAGGGAMGGRGRGGAGFRGRGGRGMRRR